MAEAEIQSVEYINQKYIKIATVRLNSIISPLL